MKHANGAQVAWNCTLWGKKKTPPRTHTDVIIRVVWWDDDKIPQVNFCRYTQLPTGAEKKNLTFTMLGS
jgi:hypothetical protein